MSSSSKNFDVRSAPDEAKHPPLGRFKHALELALRRAGCVGLPHSIAADLLESRRTTIAKLPPTDLVYVQIDATQLFRGRETPLGASDWAVAAVKIRPTASGPVDFAVAGSQTPEKPEWFTIAHPDPANEHDGWRVGVLAHRVLHRGALKFLGPPSVDALLVTLGAPGNSSSPSSSSGPGRFSPVDPAVVETFYLPNDATLNAEVDGDGVISRACYKVALKLLDISDAPVDKMYTDNRETTIVIHTGGRPYPHERNSPGEGYEVKLLALRSVLACTAEFGGVTLPGARTKGCVTDPKNWNWFYQPTWGVARIYGLGYACIYAARFK
jgi:hypothetical protein